MKKMFLITLVVLSLVFTGNAMADVLADSQSDAVAGAAIDDHSTNEYNTYDRKFVNPGVTPFPQTNGFFTTPTPDSSFRSIKEFIRLFGDGGFTVLMSEGALEEMAKGGDVVSHLQVVRGPEQVKRIYDKDYDCKDKWLWVGIEEPVYAKDSNDKIVVIGTKGIVGLKVTGLIDGEADDADTNSFQVIGKSGLKALKDGNNFMIITAENHHRMVDASGWGFGLYTTGGLTNQSGKESLTPGGGTGFASNRSTPEDKPWIHGYVGVKTDVELPNCIPVQTGNHTKYGSVR